MSVLQAQKVSKIVSRSPQQKAIANNFKEITYTLLSAQGGSVGY
jgi:hypothetical protein